MKALATAVILTLSCGTALAQVSATGPATKRFFDNADLVCKCKVSSNAVLNEQVIAQPGGGAIRRENRTSHLADSGDIQVR